MFKLPKRLINLSFIGGAIALLLIPATSSYATDLNSIFLISKSDNGNQVHYGVQTDLDCSLKTAKPVYPYWKLQNGRLEPLLAMEVPAFGIARQSVSGNEVVMEVNGFKGRGIAKPIIFRSTQSANQGCQISAFTQINGEVTQLLKVHIDLTRSGFFGLGGTVHSITFYGADEKQEKIVCKSNCRF
ncbi:DUF4833 domain-containing protein [Nodularia sphaerocarpa]|uniref:DUF4833 domain-containing protein n=1 Tax=Nodularia sphaerocarpa TaxID=137816 RepID=UPI001EFB91F4|nr:DUF4833 domain-containing protein [Nodularia sphaerocarpa]MDB9374892.1 DUF4833 domain-containing protein [Nodularia sphaerocarpa CS-585]MDB9376679.1 DUF4833 domain-containing protein [Nodularia sphaerocarpa CS-585A2]ULP71552.1 hypothetical protein BDGGKGIB_01179 [Nodularia sphaerocarpa UHCC 0038]